MADQELQTINSVLKNKDINVLFSNSVDDLFIAYADVWSSIKKYYQKYHAIPEPETIRERFGDDFEIVDVHGPARYYLDSLKEEYISNRVDALLERAAKEKKRDSSSRVAEKLGSELSKLNRFNHAADDADIMDFDEAARHYEEVRKKAEAMGGVPGVPTGINIIDSSCTTGMQGGDIVSVIGYPARGKSALTALLSANAYDKGFKPMIVSLEMSPEAVRDRVYTVMGSGLFRNSDLSLGDVNMDDFRQFQNKHGNKNEFIVVSNAAGGEVTPGTIEAKIEQYRPDIVILDYLQLMSDNGRTDDMTARMRNLSVELKRLAVRHDIPIVVISSATPDNASSIKEPPNVEQTAWSRQLSYDSSLCVAIHRHDDTNIYELVCAKNRYGPLFSGFLRWDINEGRVEEVFDLE